MSGASARLSIHVPGEASIVSWLDGSGPWTLGRDPACELQVPHTSVSRQHAIIEAVPTWCVRDLDSKNGLRVDGASLTRAELGRRNWLALGDVFCEFELIDAEIAEQQRTHETVRRHASATWIDRIAIARAIEDVLEQTLLGMVEIAECRRGFLLVGDGSSPLSRRMAFGLDPGDIDGAEFRVAARR